MTGISLVLSEIFTNCSAMYFNVIFHKLHLQSEKLHVVSLTQNPTYVVTILQVVNEKNKYMDLLRKKRKM